VRTTVGVEGIDALIEGGVPRGAAVLVAGETGTGKSVLCLQFLLAGIREGEPGVFLTAGEPGRVFETAASLGWDLRGAVEDGYAHVVQALPSGQPLPAAPFEETVEAVAAAAGAVAGGPGGGGPGGPGRGGPPGGGPGGPGGSPDGGLAGAILPVEPPSPAAATIAAVAHAVEELRAERVVIDPATAVGVAPDVASAYIADLVPGVLAETHCTTIFTGLRVHGAPGFTRLGIEEQIADGVIDLRIVEEGGHRRRALSVPSMHGTRIDLDDHPFAITPGSGIVVGE
jgi:KaiC/GvpD/RAD55 family RecA-like ATPase